MNPAIDRLHELALRWERALDRELPVAVRLRHAIHAAPRLSGDEHDTAEQMVAALGPGVGFETIAGSGRVGRLGPAGPAIALRAELDALPIVELTGGASAATNGAMHACGHDVHLAALAAVVRAADGLELPFGLVPLLQPREESYPSGALDIVAEGALHKHGVAHVIAAHVHPDVSPGAVAVGGGLVNAAADEVEIRLHGVGGHAAYPHRAADTVPAAAQIALLLPELVRRNVSPLHPALISVGTLSAGTGAANVLPAEAVVRAAMRTTDPADRARLACAVREAAEHVAAGLGIRAEVSIFEGEPPLINDPALATRVDEWLTRLDVDRAEPLRSLGADDFSYYCSAVPSIMLFVGVETPGAHPTPGLHDARFLPADAHVGDVARALLSGYLAAAEGLLESAPGHAEPRFAAASPPR